MMPAEITTFPREAIRQWQKYIDRIPNYQRRSCAKREDFLTHQVTFRGEGRTKVCGMWSLSEGGNEESNRWAVWGINSMYSFRIHREENRDWQIDDLFWVEPRRDETVYGRVCLPTNEGFPCGKRDLWSLAMRSLCQGLTLNSLWFPAMVESEDFVLESVTNVDREDERLVRVDFDYAPPNASHPVRGGFVILDPSDIG